jgi:two-component system, chemotaxis family, chemotaxis protein CheY
MIAPRGPNTSAFPMAIRRCGRASSMGSANNAAARPVLLRWRTVPPDNVCQLLVVEDDGELRSAMADMLIERGYEVLEASNGREALLTAQTCGPRLILLDLMMPVMDGWTFLKHRALDPALLAIPVLVLSAQNPDEPINDHVVAILKKPPDMKTLLTLIDKICGIERRPRVTEK